MSEVANLVLQVDSRSVDQGKKSLADLAQQSAVTEDSVKKMGGASSSLKRVGDEAGRASGAMSTMAVAAKGLVGALSIGEIARLSDVYTKYTAQLQLATTSVIGFARAQDDVRRIAKDAEADLEGTATLYARIANGTRELGFSQQRIADVTESVSLALRVSGATAAESASAMLQLSQAFASGALRGEEFNAVNEAAPRLMRALADGMGVTVGSLRTLAAEGKITSEVMGAALPQALEQLRSESSQIQTIGGAFTNLKNSVLELVGTQAQASGFVTAVSTGLNFLANNLGLVATAAAALGGARLAGSLAGWAKAQYQSVAASQAQTVALRQQAAATDGLAKSQAAAAATGAAAAGTARGVTAAMAALGGPIGIATAALIAGVSAWSSYRDSVDKTRQTLTDLSEPLDVAIEKFNKLSKVEQAGALVELRKRAQEAQAEARQAFETIEKLPGRLRASPAYKEFVESIRALPAQNLSTSALDAALDRLTQKFKDATPHATAAHHALDEYAVAAVRAGQSSDALQGRLAGVNAQGEGAAGGLDRAAIAAAKAAAGLQTEKWTEYITKLQAAATTAGMSAQQMGEFEARSMGASDAQAKLAGVLSGMADSAKKLEKATEEKDAKGIKGAKDTLAQLAAQEVQLRVNIKQAQTYAELLALGLTAGTAMQGAQTAAELEGLKTQAEIAARINAIFKNIDDNTSPSKSSSRATKSSADAIQNQIKALQLEAKTLGMAEQQAKLYKLATEGATKAQLASAKAALEAANAKGYELALAERRTDLSNDAIKSLVDEVRANEDLARNFGLSSAAIERETVSRLQKEVAQKRSAGADADEIKRLETLIDLHKRNADAMASADGQEAARAAREKYLDEWQRANEQISQSLTDALLRGFESGKSFAENFRDTLKNMFATLVLRPLIQPIAQGAAAAFMGAPGQNAGGNMLSNFSSQFNSNGLTNQLASAGSYVYNLFNGPVTSVASGATLNAAGAVKGTLDGLYAASGAPASTAGSMGAVAQPGAGISGLAAAAYGVAGSYLGGALFGNKGQSSTGGGLGAAAGATYGATYGAYGGPIGAAIGAVAGAALGSFIGSAESRKGGFYMWDAGSQMPARQGWKDGDPGAEVDKYVGDLINGAVKSINSAFEGVGSAAQLTFFSARAETSEKGRGGTSSGGSLTGVSGADRDFGTQKKGQGFGERSGDMEEMLAWLTTDVYQTVIQAWQAGADEFPSIISNVLAGVDADALSSEQAQALVAQVQETISGVNQLREGLNGLPFKNLRDLSFDATAALVELTSAVGGLEGLASLQQGYFQNYYSEEEQRAQALANITAALDSVDIAVPKTIQAFRDLVDAQDMTTDAGRKAYLALLQTSDAFAVYTRAMEDQAQQARQGAMSLYDSLLGNVRAAYDREAALLQDRVSKAENYFRSLGSYLDSLSMGNLSPLDNGEKLALARKRYEETLAKARGGDADAQGQLTSAAQEFLEASRNWNASSGEYVADYTKVQADLVTARATASSQLAISKQQLAALQRQADGILSLDETMVSLAEAIEAYLKSFGDGRNYMTLNPDVLAAFKADSGGMSMAEFAKFHFDNYGFAEKRAGAPVAEASDAQRYLNSNPDVYQAYLREKAAGYAGSAAEFARMHFDKYGRWEGRSFAVGTNRVPNDMLAMVHKDERIIPAADNRALFQALGVGKGEGGGDMARAVSALSNRLDVVVQRLDAQITQQAAIAEQDERLMSEQTEEIRRGKSRLLPA